MATQVTHPKRLIEVDLPIKRISAHARREKSIRHGHISTLHIWWARRPLAACRAVVCAALWPDPADPQCPERFRQVARGVMLQWATHHLGLSGAESYKRFLSVQKNPASLNDDTELRHALLDFIADFSDWDNSTKKEYLEASCTLTQSAHEALGGEPGTKPLVVDPFAGGGAIPLEASRIGADAFASDLNPVAVLLNKVTLEYIPKYGRRLADEIRRWGTWVKKEAVKELAQYYPTDPDGAMPIAYLWARTITCEGPGCGAEVPLTRSLWLSKKANRSIAIRMISDRLAKRVDFEIVRDAKPYDVSDGTVRRSSATCPVCGYTTSSDSVRRQLRVRKGGAADSRLFTVVTIRSGRPGRLYRLPTERDIAAVRMAEEELARRCQQESRPLLSLVPDETLPIMSGVFNAPIYGHNTWGSLFTPRQALVLTTMARLVLEVGERLEKQHPGGLAIAVQTCLGLAVSRLADRTACLCSWRPQADQEQIKRRLSTSLLDRPYR
jgi:putative DNA methylase